MLSIPRNMCRTLVLAGSHTRQHRAACLHMALICSFLVAKVKVVATIAASTSLPPRCLRS